MTNEMKKKYGVFYTPDYAVEKSTTYLRNIISQLPDDYVIVDRCCGTGNLEKFLTDEELSHCVLNTINYAEKTTLKGLYEGRVKAILPVDETTIKQALPLFAANCYVCKDFTEKEVIMKSGDGGTAYQNDQEFLEDCFLWCCLTDKNKCISNGIITNETAISQNSKADQLIDLTSPHRLSLKRKWDLVLLNAKACEEYNPNYKYGLAQIISELNLTEEQISSFKEDLKEFYNKYIEPKLFSYELLK